MTGTAADVFRLFLHLDLFLRGHVILMMKCGVFLLLLAVPATAGLTGMCSRPWKGRLVR